MENPHDDIYIKTKRTILKLQKNLEEVLKEIDNYKINEKEHDLICDINYRVEVFSEQGSEEAKLGLIQIGELIKDSKIFE